MAHKIIGSRKKVTAETLVALRAERLAEILADVAERRGDFKRRLRMELAAEEGSGPLTVEIDKRLTASETSRGKITWRAGAAFIRDLDALRDLIEARLAALDVSAAVDRLWRFMDTATPSSHRYRERNGELDAIYARAAAELGGFLPLRPVRPAAAAMVESLTRPAAPEVGPKPAILAGQTLCGAGPTGAGDLDWSAAGASRADGGDRGGRTGAWSQRGRRPVSRLDDGRRVTLIGKENLLAIARFLGLDRSLDPSLIRRPIVVAGINLLARKDQQFRVGEALLETSGECHRCSRMEEILGDGGYNAMGGQGGITARVIEGSLVRLGDTVTRVDLEAP